MNFAQFSANLPSDRTMRFTSVEEVEEFLAEAGVDQPMRQLGTGPLRASIAMLATPDAEFFSDRYNQRVALHLAAPPGSVGLLFPRTASGEFWVAGENIRNDRLVLFTHSSGVDIIGPALVGSEAITIPETRLREISETLFPAWEMPEDTAIVKGDTARLRVLRRAVANLVACADSTTINERSAALIAQIIGWMDDSMNQREPAVISRARTRVRVARSARDYIESRYSEAIRIEDLCLATHSSARTLQRCFREYFDTSISEYVKTVRLDSARRELVTAVRKETSVASVAMRHGCKHLGRFSVDFRRRFGKSPREMLAIRPGKK